MCPDDLVDEAGLSRPAIFRGGIGQRRDEPEVGQRLRQFGEAVEIEQVARLARAIKEADRTVRPARLGMGDGGCGEQPEGRDLTGDEAWSRREAMPEWAPGVTVNAVSPGFTRSIRATDPPRPPSSRLTAIT